MSDALRHYPFPLKPLIQSNPQSCIYFRRFLDFALESWHLTPCHFQFLSCLGGSRQVRPFTHRFTGVTSVTPSLLTDHQHIPNLLLLLLTTTTTTTIQTPPNNPSFPIASHDTTSTTRRAPVRQTTNLVRCSCAVRYTTLHYTTVHGYAVQSNSTTAAGGRPSVELAMAEEGDGDGDALKALLDSIPAAHQSTAHDSASASHVSLRSPLKCCCGHADCAYLNHNSNALDDLEKDVRRAAQLGQVCGMFFSFSFFCFWFL